MTAGIFIDRPIQVIPVIPSDAEREKRCLLLEAELQTRNRTIPATGIKFGINTGEYKQYYRIVSQQIISHSGVDTSKNNNISDNDVFCFRQSIRIRYLRSQQNT
jgi:hypothetical protein